MGQNTTKTILLFGVIFCCALGVNAQLNGNYTIDASASGSTNYTSIASAISDLNTVGVSGAVVFDISDGTYNGQITLDVVSGASSTNTVTFQSVSGHWSNVTLTNNGTITLYLDGADHIRFNHVTIENTSFSGTCYNVRMDGGADHNKFKDVRFKAPNRFGYNVYNYYGSFNEFEDNRFVGGYYAQYHYGARGASAEKGLVVKNNVLVGYEYYGLYFYGQSGANVVGNICDSSINQNAYGVYSNTNQNSIIMNNEIYGGCYTGLYLYNENRYGASKDSSICANNISRENTLYGAIVQYSNNVSFHHNIVEGGSNYSLYVYSYAADAGDGLRFANNIFISEGAYYGMYYYTYNSGTSSQILPGYFDYNDLYFANNTYLSYFAGALATTFVAMQGLHSSAYNQNSLMVDPDLKTKNGRTTAFELNNAGVDVKVNKDIDGNLRPNALDKKVDIGSNDFYLPPFDLDIESLISPLSANPISNTFQVTFHSCGTITFSNVDVDVHYTVDSGKTWVSDTMNIASLKGGGSKTFTFSTPWKPSRTGSFGIGIKIDKQVPGDPDLKDEKFWNVCTGLTGTYTVGSVLADFPSIEDAVKRLECGVAGPIVFELQGGTYTGNIKLKELHGASAINTVTFKSPHIDSVTIAANSGATLDLDGVDYVAFENIKIEAISSGAAVWMRNEANYNRFSGCEIKSPNSNGSHPLNLATSLTSVFTYGNAGNYNVFEDNEFIGGYYGGAVAVGTSTVDMLEGNEFYRNRFSGANTQGVHLYYLSGTVFHDNIVEGMTSSYSYAMYAFYLSNFDFQRNVFKDAYYGSYFYYLNYYNYKGTRSTFANNSMPGSGLYGLYSWQSRYVDFWHNSITSATYGWYSYYLTDVDVRNNIFHVTSGTGIYSLIPSFAEFDHNNFYVVSGSAAYLGADYPTIKELKRFDPAFNKNNFSLNPEWVDVDADLHLTAKTPVMLGVNVGIANDVLLLPVLVQTRCRIILYRLEQTFILQTQHGYIVLRSF